MKKSKKKERPTILGQMSYGGKEASNVSRKFGVRKGSRHSYSQVSQLICKDCGFTYADHNREVCPK